MTKRRLLLKRKDDRGPWLGKLYRWMEAQESNNGDREMQGSELFANGDRVREFLQEQK